MYYTFSADVLVVYSSNISQRGQHVQRHSHTYVHTHLIGQTCHLFSPPHTYIFIHARPSRLHTHAPHIHPPFYSFTHTNASIPPTHPNYSPLRKLPFFTHSPRPIYRHSSPSSQSKKSVNFEALHTVPRASGSKGTPVSRRAASRTPSSTPWRALSVATSASIHPRKNPVSRSGPRPRFHPFPDPEWRASFDAPDPPLPRGRLQTRERSLSRSRFPFSPVSGRTGFFVF